MKTKAPKEAKCATCTLPIVYIKEMGKWIHKHGYSHHDAVPVDRAALKDIRGMLK